MASITGCRHKNTTTPSKNADGRTEYLLLNAYSADPLVASLVEKPCRYASGRRNSYSDGVFDDLRIIRSADGYGLVRDWAEEMRSTVLLDARHSRKQAEAAAYCERLEAEAACYARVIAKTPRHFPGRAGDGWDTVPKDIHDRVIRYMAAHALEQPETAADL
ncbi:MAG: hypothetical protein GXY32_05810 [Ruminococcaceae bacterium]|nr:hypothetical protein [Oscillospiraceae bacterium]